MITVISGTNRKGSRTRNIVFYYRDLLERSSEKVAVLLPEGVDLNKRTPELKRIENEMLIPSDKFVFILPEYNGSFPGAIKTIIDMCHVTECFYGKKALLTGVADGRAGNLRGLEHFTGILNHMGVIVHPDKLPISVLKRLVNEEGDLIDEGTKKVIEKQVKEFLEF